MSKKIKILFFIPNLMAGGAERVISFLTNNLNPKKFDCTLIVIGWEEDLAYEIDKTKVKFLDKERVLYSIPKLIKTVKNENPDIVIGTVSHLNIAIGIVSLFFFKVVFIARQAAITKVSFNLNQPAKKSLFSILLGKALRRMDYVICQSQDMAIDCIQEFNLDKSNLKIIQNPITDSFSIKESVNGEDKNKYNFITVGRLAEIKGHHRILKLLSKVKIPFNYTIIGDGPLKKEIFDEVERLGLTKNVHHIPYTNEVDAYLRKNDYFLQGSLSEGFPNALLESCAVGTPAIAFDVPGGTKEIIENGVNGFLVQNEEEFLARLHNLPTLDPINVSASVYKKFDKAIILEKYEQFFMEIAKNK